MRRMTVDDVTATAEIHARALPHGFFARLGRRFLAAYHRSFVDSPHAIALVATLDDRVAGYLVGTLRTQPHYRHVVRHHGARLGVHAVAGVVRHPSVLLELVRSRLGRYLRTIVRYLQPGDRGRTSQRRRRGAVAVLTHVAVLESARGHGLGADLVAAFVDEVRGTTGTSEIRLVTRAGDDGAGAFYDRLGWERLHERWSADGQWVTEYRCPT